MIRTVTPREAIQFSARLRLGNDHDYTTEDINSVTDQILKELGLETVADTQIGNSVRTFLSGGELTRVRLGVELVVCPSILLLDEVTSGLDSKNAMQVVDVLKKLSRCGTSILLTVHQPNR